jgi:ATP-binding cassette subfamily B multidrug efflux pump
MNGLGAPRSPVGDAPTSVIRRLAGLLAERRGSMAVVGILVLAAAAVELVPPLVVRDVVDRHVMVGRPDGLPTLALLYLLAIAAVQALTFLYGYLAATVAHGVLSDLRTRLFAHLQRLPTSFFDRVPIGDVISRCTADVETLDTVFSSGVAVLLAHLVRLVTIAVAMVVLSPGLCLVAALVAAPLVLITRALQVRVRQAERETRLAIGEVNTRLGEDLRGIEAIRAFGREPEFIAGFRQVLGRGLAASNRSSFYSALYTPVTAIVSAIAVAALLSVGAPRAFGAASISLGTLTAFLLLLQRFFQPITALGEEWHTVQGAMAGAERIFDTLAIAPDNPPVPGRGRTNRERPAGTVVLSDVEFGYAPGRPVLDALSLQVRAGEHVALVGRTGAGKTSALHLMAGLYRPWAGRVLVAGRDPAGLAEAERRRVLGVVPQVVQLFSGTVLDNLTLGDPGVTEDAVREAAAIAGIDPFIRALPDGYQTRLAPGGGGAGTPLSAGQRQLVALARALIHRPAVVLLDEATAAIDSASDAAFRATLRECVLPRGATVVTIAHRLTTALDADRVIVLDKGRIVEEGVPAALIASGGRFAALRELEAAGWDWRGSA